jgi:hypothetical protein
MTPLNDTWAALPDKWGALDFVWARGVVQEFNSTFAGLTFTDFALIPLKKQ